jgi:xanthine dehydrogenase accessory factor
MIDPEGSFIGEIQPYIVVDAILAKRNIGTRINWAPIVIGLGPGFTAGLDVHAVVETKRGHYLGRVYYEGRALPDTGIPGEVGGASVDRIVRSSGEGRFMPAKKIGDKVIKDEILGYVEGIPVKSPLQGVLRGLINPNVTVKEGMKIGDVDPRDVEQHCWSISDKARAIGGGVLEAILHLSQNQKDG